MTRPIRLLGLALLAYLLAVVAALLDSARTRKEDRDA